MAFDLPVVIARMNASYSAYGNGGLPTIHLDTALAGNPIVTRWDPCFYSPIHQDDINAQTEALLDAAAVPAPIVNWAGDEPVSVQQWAVVIGELIGKEPEVQVNVIPGTLRGSIASNVKRLAITGPCAVDFRDGLRRVHQERTSPPSNPH